jgi:hypothetical protein
MVLLALALTVAVVLRTATPANDSSSITSKSTKRRTSLAETGSGGSFSKARIVCVCESTGRNCPNRLSMMNQYGRSAPLTNCNGAQHRAPFAFFRGMLGSIDDLCVSPRRLRLDHVAALAERL